MPGDWKEAISDAFYMKTRIENGECNLRDYRDPGSRRYGRSRGRWVKDGAAMKNLSRFIFGVLSSLLFAVGFARAADQLDPMSLGRATAGTETVISAAPDCVSSCNLVDR